ncbi:hypothetical protein BVRB_7g168540 [Beta vulgaris subsp. vulgaris]|uniref:probable disease resistance protein At1g52660 n=1 Tax=Beta vulgaris subsp. vulgaris TaxID=3555 RepID=UPI00053F5F2D|nr:probable disease resistance protein At1g52660 [Beta vulgaris subsp. vulgaris]KMT04671.1 hypothetical protein BVRB_7g168540 [Beta vulgaris subsp. vulgaris]
MDIITMLWGLVGLLALLFRGHNIAERKRLLQGKLEYLRARMQDIGDFCSTRFRRGKKQKLDNDQLEWMDEARELIKKAEFVLGRHVGGWRGFLMGVKTWDVEKLVDAFEVHDKKGDELFGLTMSDARVLHRGYYIPVKALVGEVASSTLNQLELLLQDDNVGRIAIHGVEGVGKTFLMKHLHNSAVKWVEKFDHVFWVTFSSQFTIEHVQDLVAALVNCDFTSDDDLNLRASELSDTLAGLGNFALFLDGVPGAEFSLDQVGIRVPAEGSKCKVVLTTISNLECRLLDHFEAVKVDPLPKEEGYQLFMREANIGEAFVSSLDGISNSLADRCSGLPHMIVNIATHMYGIDDSCEWRNALYEFGRLGMKNKLLPIEGVTYDSSPLV